MKPSDVVARSDDTGYEAYGQFLKDELAGQDARKASFEQRGVAVITTSGALATLLLGLAAVTTSHSKTFVLPASARTWLGLAVLFFFVSAIGAILTNLPLRYQVAKADEVKSRLREDPPKTATEATRDIALTRVKALRSAKTKNSFKGWALVFAMGFQALAVGSMALAISQAI